MPPAAASASAIVAPSHTLTAPVIVPAFGTTSMFIVCSAVDVPHPLVTEYCMMSVPVATPVIIPETDIVALPLLALHTPPAMASETVMVAPVHTLADPMIVPG